MSFHQSGGKARPRPSTDTQALFNIAFASLQSGDMSKAEAHFLKVVAKAPGNSDALHLLGVTKYLQKDYADAQRWISKALAIRKVPAYLINLALTLAAQAQDGAAVDAYRKAIAFGPQEAKVYNNLGNLLKKLKDVSGAESNYRQAIETNASYALAHKNLAMLLQDAGRLDEAEMSLKRALQLNPDSADFLLSYGDMLERLHRLAEAEDVYGRGGQWDSVQYIKRQRADWDQLDAIDAAAMQQVTSVDAGTVSTWSLLGMPGLTPEAHRLAGKRFALSRWGAELAAPETARRVDANCARLRIGYLSSDFYDHATMHLLAGVLELHDAAGFDIHLYSYGPVRDDLFTKRIAHMPAIFHDLSACTNDAAARQIADDGIHLLVDLKGYTTGARPGITALRPAPVIVSWLGYPGSLGHPRLADYIIGDAVVTPVSAAPHYSETLALLPNCYQPNDHRRECGARPSRAAAGLPEEGFVFCSFNQTFKFNADMFAIWCRLLLAIPRSVLWLLKPPIDEAAENLRRFVAARGIDSAHLVFADRLPQTEHLARLQLADLALDTFPCGSHTTGSDALWAGVPMVTRPGVLFASRVGASLLRAVGLDELVAEDDEAYFQLALSLAQDPVRLAGMRARLIAQRLSSPLFDTRKFTRDLERLYSAMWLREASGENHRGEPLVLDAEG
jgi:protein O-GlcNAc transferase